MMFKHNLFGAAAARMLVTVSLVFCLAMVAEAAPKGVEHVFIISIDGGKPAVILDSKMPVLEKMVTEGAHTWTATTTVPSITLPSHTSMLTGVPPTKHHILWNDFEPEQGTVEVPTVFSMAKAAGFSTAMFVGKEKFRQLLRPGSVDEFSYNAGEEIVLTKTNQGKVMHEGTVLAKFVASDAADYIAMHKPNVCFIHFTDTDDTGHKYGWGSKEQKQAFADVDAGLGVVLEAITRAGIADSSVVIVTADHGGHKHGHGTTSPEDMHIPWVVWGAGVKRGEEIKDAVNTCDTTATALWLLGVQVPESMDGKPVTNAFEETKVTSR